MGVAGRSGARPAFTLVLLMPFSGCISPLDGTARSDAGPPVAAPLPPAMGPLDAAAPAIPPAPAAVDATPPPPGDGPPASVDARPPPDSSPATPAPTGRAVESAAVSGFQLLVRWRNPDGSVDPPTPFDIRGISWSPAEQGGLRPLEPDHLRLADRDLPLMRAANINTVKSYGPLGPATLDKLHAHGLVAIVTVFVGGDSAFEPAVQAVRNHPALLMWLVGNEWNLNRLYDSCNGDGCYQRIEQVASRIKALDPRHPVATSFAPAGEIPTESDLRRLPSVDVWGLNIYSQPGFFNRFSNWRLLAQQTGLRKPFFLSEYGADAYDNVNGRPDQEAQARALRQQTFEIRNQLSARNPAFPCLGGTPFEWNDEWWKRGNPGVQDVGGFANGGVAADRFANEEWWGVVDIDRKPRPAYQVLKELYAQ